MWPDHRLCELLDVEHPIIQAPMMDSCTPDLAGAVSGAGGLGSLAIGGKPVEIAQQQVAAIRSITERPFNLNFFIVQATAADPELFSNAKARLQRWYEAYELDALPDPPAQIGPGFDEERLELVLSLRPKVVSFHFGSPAPELMTVLKDAGLVLLSTATNVAEARFLEAAGMDAIIAQGWEAGGHRGAHASSAPFDGVGTMALVPQVVDAVSVPVIAAGGIADGRGIAAALALGASGVQMGTAFLGCPETATESVWRDILRDSTDQSTMVTDGFSGQSARVLRSRFSEEMEAGRVALPPFPQLFPLVRPIREAATREDVSFIPMGQAAPLARRTSARDLVTELVSETKMALASLKA